MQAASTPRFSISHWATWPDPLALDGDADAGSPTPDLPAMPAMQRRRVERLGRMALHVAYASLGGDVTPLVFASRWGDIRKSVGLIAQLNADGMSPMAFSLSVHNAIAAQFSIARGDTGSYTAIAAGEGSIEAAFIEALGQLADGNDAVTIVCYDEPLPPPYSCYSQQDEVPRAWACRVMLAADGEFELAALASDVEVTTAADDNDAPGDLVVLDYLRSQRSQLLRQVGAARWLWRRHA